MVYLMSPQNQKEKKMNKVILFLFLIVGALTLNAQPGRDNNVIIQAPYQAKVADSQKFLEQPAITDTSTGRMKIDYELNSRRINTVYEVDPIKAASVKGEPLSKLYRGYVKGGFGNYNTPYAELYYNNLRSKKYSNGVHYRHLSSGGQINDVGYSGFSQNELNLFGKSFIKKSTISGGIDYKRNVVHYYGFNTNPLDPIWENYGLERQDIKQRYQLINLDASLTDNFPVDSRATKYRADLKYYNYSDLYNVQENLFRAAGDVSFYYKTNDFNVRGGLDYYKNQDSASSSGLTIFNLQPRVNVQQNKWRLKAGINNYITSDKNYSFLIAPEFDFDLHIYRNVIILNVGTDSRFRRNSYKNLTEENPFLINSVPLQNTWSPFRFFAGLRGNLSSRMSFNVKASFVKVQGQYFFVNDTSLGNWNKLNVVYDNASLTEVNGEITWQKNEKLRIIAKADYFGYTPDSELKAWHTPSLRLSFTGKYNLADKIWINATILGINRQYAREFGIDSMGNEVVTAKELKGIADVNLGAEYRYTKLLGMFVQFNNIFNVRYQRYNNYPTQRFNLLAGVSYSF